MPALRHALCSGICFAVVATCSTTTHTSVQQVTCTWKPYLTTPNNMLYPWNHSMLLYNFLSWFVYIQGPPGTGKTFLTSRIIQSLLNVQKPQTPIVVMAYKNRVLDQLVSMCTTFCGDGEIIRLGRLSEDYQQDKRLQACLMPQKGNTDVEVQCLQKRYCFTAMAFLDIKWCWAYT